MGYNKLDITSTYEHEPEDEIILLTEEVKPNKPKIQKKGNTMIKINVIRDDLVMAEEAATNAKYNKLLAAELALIGLVILSALVLT